MSLFDDKIQICCVFVFLLHLARALLGSYQRGTTASSFSCVGGMALVPAHPSKPRVAAARRLRSPALPAHPRPRGTCGGVPGWVVWGINQRWVALGARGLGVAFEPRRHRIRDLEKRRNLISHASDDRAYYSRDSFRQIDVSGRVSDPFYRDALQSTTAPSTLQRLPSCCCCY